ncbi:LPS assembly lipoprotein LptE [Ideonella sp. B508-1]|uniref:LPS-assembly lipoprotein LptE n=1 Tax=Ideonella sp. B508-1 TaxID=137716 RepID=UPI000349B1D7|nr:LPS assembly lipoprotein LptE [Ideonella sp. B508-1]
MSASHPTRRSWTLGLAATSLAVALSGCGFELRRPPELPYTRIALVGFPARSPMESALRAALPDSAEVVQSTAQAEVVLTAVDDRTYRIVAASTTAGQVREFRLRVQLKFRLSRPDGRVLLNDTELQRERDLSYTETAALSKQTEEEALLQEMRQDLAQQVLRMLVVAAHKPLPPLPAASAASAP